MINIYLFHPPSCKTVILFISAPPVRHTPFLKYLTGRVWYIYIYIYGNACRTPSAMRPRKSSRISWKRCGLLMRQRLRWRPEPVRRRAQRRQWPRPSVASPRSQAAGKQSLAQQDQLAPPSQIKRKIWCAKIRRTVLYLYEAQRNNPCCLTGSSATCQTNKDDLTGTAQTSTVRFVMQTSQTIWWAWHNSG